MKSKLQIPFKTGSAEYQRAVKACNRLGKKWSELTPEEQRAAMESAPRAGSRTVALVVEIPPLSEDAERRLQEYADKCRAILAEALKLDPKAPNPFEALFYVADIQKDLLAELRTMNATLEKILQAQGPRP